MELNDLNGCVKHINSSQPQLTIFWHLGKLSPRVEKSAQSRLCILPVPGFQAFVGSIPIAIQGRQQRGLLYGVVDHWPWYKHAHDKKHSWGVRVEGRFACAHRGVASRGRGDLQRDTFGPPGGREGQWQHDRVPIVL